MVKLLLANGADASICDLDGELPRQYAALSGHTEVQTLAGIAILSFSLNNLEERIRGIKQCKVSIQRT